MVLRTVIIIHSLIRAVSLPLFTSLKRLALSIFGEAPTKASTSDCAVLALLAKLTGSALVALDIISGLIVLLTVGVSAACVYA